MSCLSIAQQQSLHLKKYFKTISLTVFIGSCYYIMLLMCIFASQYVFADDNDLDYLQHKGQTNEWIQSKDDKRRGIRAWYKQEEGKHVRTFKIAATLNVPMEQTAMALVDGNSWQRWFWECLESKSIKEDHSTGESIYYMRVNVPMPFPDRDTVMHAKIEPYSKEKGKIILRFHAMPNYMKDVPKVVRAKEFTFKIELTPVDENKTQLELEGYVDPGKDLPAWAVNFMMRNAPYSSVLGLERYVRVLGEENKLRFKFRE